METHLRSVAGVGVEGAELADPPRTFEEFYDAERGRLFTALCLVTANRHEAEEIAQDAFLRVLERWDRVSGLENPEGYLFRAAMNVFRNRYRRSMLAFRRTLAFGPSGDDLAAVEDRDEVIRMLRGLAPRQRAAVLLTAFMDYSSEEAGRMLGIRPSTVRALASQARARLKHGKVHSR
jgi:RNA polymerase sigma-70 factor, ECF subfamily